jgi:hypothetical protein
MVINTYEDLVPNERIVGTILNDTKNECHVHFRVIREITKQEYFEKLAQTTWAWTISQFIPHDSLRYFEVEELPD